MYKSTKLSRGYVSDAIETCLEGEIKRFLEIIDLLDEDIHKSSDISDRSHTSSVAFWLVVKEYLKVLIGHIDICLKHQEKCQCCFDKDGKLLHVHPRFFLTCRGID